MIRQFSVVWGTLTNVTVLWPRSTPTNTGNYPRATFIVVYFSSRRLTQVMVKPPSTTMVWPVT